ncbi:hypothetical protein AB0B28_03715 [Glycomyces sp. NPDC046736]|uniref:hypothetical protein n=1 Tax=Glycomyces sp. NPDC046736 TaxID=3155615 RepID=UPI0033DDAB7A
MNNPSFTLEGLARLRGQIETFRRGAGRFLDGLGVVPVPTPEDLIDPESERAATIGKLHTARIGAENDIRVAGAALEILDRMEAHLVAGRPAQAQEEMRELKKVQQSLQSNRFDPPAFTRPDTESPPEERRRGDVLRICAEMREKTTKMQASVQRSHDKAASLRPDDSGDPKREEWYAGIELMRDAFDADLGIIDAMLAVIARAETHAKAGRIHEAARLFEIVDRLGRQLSVSKRERRRSE